MLEKLKRTSRQFTTVTVALAVLSVAIVTFALYEANLTRYSSEFNSDDLTSAVVQEPEVQAYLETEHENEAHFVTIANLIRQQQRQDLADTMLIITIPLIVFAGILGYLASKYLLKPVEKAYDSQERFIQDAAHELRNPLAAMSAVIQNARSNPPKSSADSKDMIMRLNRQLKRLVRINEELLYLEKDEDPYSGEAQDISTILLDVVEDLKPLASEQKLEIKSKIEQDIMLTIEPKEFVRVSKNLIENAIKYSKKSSKNVNVELFKDKSSITLRVKDSGVGIPSEALDNIGERFFRAKNVNAIDGTGLGLSIVNKVLDRYYAQLSIESTYKKGTTVSVIFKN